MDNKNLLAAAVGAGAAFALCRATCARGASNLPACEAAYVAGKGQAWGRRTDKLEGRCYCGAVKYEVNGTADIKRSVFCYCESCRRAHAAPVYMVCYIEPSDFNIVAGKGVMKAVPFQADPNKGWRSFCGECGSRICNVMHDGAGGVARTGFFQSTLTEATQHALPERFYPTLHYCPEEAVLPVMADDLERYACGSFPKAK